MAKVSLFSVLAFAASALASNSFTSPLSGEFYAGSTMPIQWTPDDSSKVNLYLMYGTSNALVTVSEIANGIANSGSVNWQIPTSVVTRTDYSLKITAHNNDKDVNYSPEFAIVNTLTSASSAAATSSVVSIHSLGSWLLDEKCSSPNTSQGFS
jgi:alpha-L-arabinofuranosidase